jgi:hypothetical protein
MDYQFLEMDSVPWSFYHLCNAESDDCKMARRDNVIARRKPRLAEEKQGLAEQGCPALVEVGRVTAQSTCYVSARLTSRLWNGTAFRSVRMEAQTQSISRCTICLVAF